MKCEIALYVAQCDIFQRVKAEHQRPAGFLQSIKVPQWKWEEVGMDFITGLPRSSRGHDSIWVIVDRLTKVAHFIPVKTTYTGSHLAELYISRIVSLHGVKRRLCQTEVPNSLQGFGPSCTKDSEHTYLSALLSTRKPTDRLKG